MLVVFIYKGKQIFPTSRNLSLNKLHLLVLMHPFKHENMDLLDKELPNSRQRLIS